MDIHESENNLGEFNNSSENIGYHQTNPDDNLCETNPYAGNSSAIHAEQNDDIIVSNIEEKHEEQPTNISNEYFKAKINMLISNHNKRIKNKKMMDYRRNYIMRSAVIHNQSSNNKVKQLIHAGKSNKPNNSLNLMSKLTKPPDNPKPDDSNKKISTEHATDKKFENPNNLIKSLSLTNRADFLIGQSTQHVEKPKEVNLEEILTGVLQEVALGKLNSLENVIGKLRINFEEKNVFANTYKRNVILLNFEDDTMRPVLKIDEKYMTIIKKWYNDCDLLIDIEDTDVSIPEVITSQDISGVLFQDINYKFKDEYLNSYIPLVINNIITEGTIKGFEKKYFNKTSTVANKFYYQIEPKYYEGIEPKYYEHIEQKTCNILGDNILSDIGIIIPENLIPEPLKPRQQGENYIINNITNENDGILVKKLILDDVKPNETLSYNYLFNTLDECNLSNCSKDNNDVPVGCYNSEYNTLYPNFSDNCARVDNNNYQVEEKKISSIFVLINDKFLQTLAITNPNPDMLHIIKNHSEFGFIKLFGIETNNNDVINFIEREFNKVHFNDIDEVNKKLILTSQYIDFSNKHNNSNNIVSSEENEVKKFLKNNYTIDNDINHKMKASTLYELIINSNVVKIDNDKIAGFRTRLSKYLKDIGLQKKRYNDGYYYYGIVHNHTKFYTSKGHNKDIDINDVIKKRSEELNSFFHT